MKYRLIRSIAFILILFSVISCNKDVSKASMVSQNNSVVYAMLSDYTPCLSRIDVDSQELPQEVFDFLDEYYPGEGIESSSIVGNNEFYLIALDDESQSEILFNTGGIFVYSQGGFLGPNALAELPVQIENYIITNFPDNNVVEHCSFSDMGTLYIHIELDPSGGFLFDTENNFLCAYDYNCQGEENGEDEEEEDDENEDDENEEDESEEDENVDLDCPRQKGYWKTHSEVGPAPLDSAWLEMPNASVTPFFNSTYSFLEILQEAAGNNSYLKLAQQHVVAQLNVAAGFEFPMELNDQWNQATDLLIEYEEIGDISDDEISDFAMELWHDLKDFNTGGYSDCN